MNLLFFLAEVFEMFQKMMSVFQGDVLAKVRSFPETAEYTKQPDFVEKIKQIQQDPEALLQY
jgi:hypothetical protein